MNETTRTLRVASHNFTTKPTGPHKINDVVHGGMRKTVFLEYFNRSAGRVVKASGDIIFVGRLELSTRTGAVRASEPVVNADVALVHVHRSHTPRSTLKPVSDVDVPAAVSAFHTGTELYGGDTVALCDAWDEHMPCDAVVLSDTIVLVHVSSILSPAYLVPKFDCAEPELGFRNTRRVNWHLRRETVEPIEFRPILFRIGPLH